MDAFSSGNERNDSSMAVSPERPGSLERRARGNRKRTIVSVPSSDDDGEVTAAAAPKIPTARRGRQGRAFISGQHFGISKAREDLRRLEALEYEDGSQSESSAQYPDNDRISLDIGRLPAESLRVKALNKIDDIVAATGRSRNLKGEIKKTLNDAACALGEIVESLSTLTASEETRRLQADNKRLSREVENMKAELKALRQHVSEKTSQPERRNPTGPVSEQKRAPAIDGDTLDELKRTLLNSVGKMLNARFGDLECRLLPAERLRPPLAADKKGGRPEAIQKKTAPVSSDPSGLSGQPNTVSQPERVVRAPPPEERWETVVSRKKKRRRKKKKVDPSVPSATSQPPRKTATPLKRKLTAPRSSAVIITISQEVADSGFTYAQAIAKAKSQFTLQELGIGGVTIKPTATGARILEVPGAASGKEADLLAEKLKTVLDGMANVSRPTKCANLRISGLDDSVEGEEVKAAVAAMGQCPLDQVKVGPIRVSPEGMGSAMIRCPVMAAKAIMETGRLLVGWSAARVRAMEPLPMRCFKCMGLGHTRQLCPSESDRSGQCFRCSKSGHKAADCVAEPRCAICVEAKLPSSHVMGGRNCSPPHTRGKIASKTQGRTQTLSASALEEVEMSS